MLACVAGLSTTVARARANLTLGPRDRGPIDLFLPPRQHLLSRPLSSRRIRPNANVTWNTSCKGNGSRTMSLRAKLIAVFALFGVAPIVALGVFTYVRSMQAVEDLVAT